jgi:hypothetical protein
MAVTVAAEPDAPESRAASLLENLVGDWCFELTIASEPDRASVTGQRSFEPHEFAHALRWREKIDGLDIELEGVLGYTPSTDSFYEFGLTSSGIAELSNGAWLEDGDGVSFSSPGEKSQTELRVHDAQRFEFVRRAAGEVDAGPRWRAQFTRCEEQRDR